MDNLADFRTMGSLTVKRIIVSVLTHGSDYRVLPSKYLCPLSLTGGLRKSLSA